MLKEVGVCNQEEQELLKAFEAGEFESVLDEERRTQLAKSGPCSILSCENNIATLQ